MNQFVLSTPMVERIVVTAGEDPKAPNFIATVQAVAAALGTLELGAPTGQAVTNG